MIGTWVLRWFGVVGLGIVLFGATGCGGLNSPAAVNETLVEPALPVAASAARLREHVAFLADDALLGREPGTPGYDMAADYVAKEFRALGLQGAGDANGFFQMVPLRRSVRDADQVRLSVIDSSSRSLPLKKNVDFVVGGSLRSEHASVSAPVVFAGFGLVAPELDRDDYSGLDVRGKIVAVLAGTPDGLQSEERAFYGAQRAREASRRGAVGMISLTTPLAESLYSFARIINEGRMDAPRMGWVDDEGHVYSNAPNLQVSARFSLAGAAKLFAAAPTSWDAVLTAAKAEGGVTPTFELGLTMTIKQASTHSDIESANVLGLLPGSDPVLQREVLVLSAHLDHLGVSTTDEEDKINNGALDNAAGVATLLEAARLLLAGERPRRSVLFLANTAEETGLLGAQYFAKQPTVAGERMVANINLDMPLLTYDFRDVVVFGGTRSTLRTAIESAAAQMGLGIGEDPFPEQGIFTRSDHFRFVEEGIPSVMLATGMANGGKKAWAEHFAKHYHRPSDEIDNGLDFAAAAKFAELKTRITLMVANADERPLWHQGDFFARQFNGPMSAN